MLELLKNHAPNPQALEAAWIQLKQLGGHPDAEPYRIQLEQLCERSRAWNIFIKVPQSASQDCDLQLIKAWQERLFSGWDQAEQHRSRVALARQRIELIEELKEVVGKIPQNISIQTERVIYVAAKNIPHGYSYQLKGRVKQAIQRLQLVKLLQQQALLKPSSDLAIAKVWQKLEELNCQDVVPSQFQPRIRLALKRIRLLLDLKKLPQEYTSQQAPKYDDQILAAWDECFSTIVMTLNPGAIYKAAAERKDALTQLRVAITSSDNSKIVDIVELPCLANYPWSREVVKVIHRAKDKIVGARNLLGVLKNDERSRFLEVFDARIVRENSSTFAPYHTLICEWLKTDVLPADRLKLSLPTGRRALVKEEGSSTNYQVCWNWPLPRFTEQCMLIICPEKPNPTDNPREIPVHFRQLVDRARYEEGGGSLLIHTQPDWLRGYIAVWAIIDLGFATFFSECLVLGRLCDLSAKRAGKKLKGLS